MSNHQAPKTKQHVNWASVLWYIHLHVLGLYAIWLCLTSAKWMTVWFTFFITAIGCLGMTAGAHRMWAHKAYIARSDLKFFLMLACSLTGVGSIRNWVLYHRLHHKYFGTEKDQYNYKKGFLYSHYVGLCLSPVVDYKEAQREIDMRDVDKDGCIWFQDKFYWPIFIICGIILPLNAPLEYWDESMTETIMITGILRFAITMNVSSLIHSAPNVWGVAGNKLPLKNFSVFFIRKSFWPWYHHLLPCDWKCGEFGTYDIDYTSFFVKMCRELSLINSARTTTTDDVREVLHRVAKKEFSLQKGLDELQEISLYNAKKEKLLLRY